MNKRDVIDEIIRYLDEEIRELAARAECGACESHRVEELKNLRLMYQYLPARTLGSDDVVCPAALVEVETNGVRSHVFVAPKGGGLITRVGGVPLQVITARSPLGEVLLGRRQGDVVEVEIRGEKRSYWVVGVG